MGAPGAEAPAHLSSTKDKQKSAREAETVLYLEYMPLCMGRQSYYPEGGLGSALSGAYLDGHNEGMLFDQQQQQQQPPVQEHPLWQHQLEDQLLQHKHKHKHHHLHLPPEEHFQVRGGRRRIYPKILLGAFNLEVTARRSNLCL